MCAGNVSEMLHLISKQTIKQRNKKQELSCCTLTFPLQINPGFISKKVFTLGVIFCDIAI